MFTDYSGKTGGSLLTFTKKADTGFTRMPSLPWDITSAFLLMLSKHQMVPGTTIVSNMVTGKQATILSS